MKLWSNDSNRCEKFKLVISLLLTTIMKRIKNNGKRKAECCAFMAKSD